MASKRDGVKTPSFTAWWKHLRPYGKRAAAKLSRKAGKKETRGHEQ